MSNKLKRNYIQLVEGEKEDGTLIFENYLTPHFIPTDMWYECIDVMSELESMEEEEKKAREKAEESGDTSELKNSALMMKEQIDLLMDTVVKIYDGKFTKKDLRAKLHAPDLVNTLRDQVQFVAMGQQDEATKKFVASKQ